VASGKNSFVGRRTISKTKNEFYIKNKIMKKAALLFSIVLSLSLYAQESGIQFSKDSLLSQALAKSKSEGKLVFIDCYTSWCGPCKHLASTIFPVKEVGDFYNSHFINVSFDMEKGEGKNIASKYDIKAYPTLLFLNADGEIVHQSIGSPVDANAFIELGKTALDSTRNLLSIINKMKSGDKSIETLMQYLGAYPYAKDNAVLVDDYFKTASDEAKMSKEAWMLFRQFVSNIDNVQFQYFLNHRNAYTQKFGKKDVDNKIKAGFKNHIYRNKNNPEKAVSVKHIDPELFSVCMIENDFSTAATEFYNNKTDKKSWDNYMAKTKKVMDLADVQPLFINDVCWNIYMNYRTFNDITAIKSAKIWQEKALKELPDNHPINDTYAHILFALGYVKEAIEHEELAIKVATEQKSQKDLDFYNDEIKVFRKKL
jgi:thiol-disulfide isomerase/thioredoxin